MNLASKFDLPVSCRQRWRYGNNGLHEFLYNGFSVGPKHRQRFLCEVRVEGHTYVGAGNSTNKKDAQSNAAKDFVSYLVRQGFVNKKEVPADIDAAPTIHRKI